MGFLGSDAMDKAFLEKRGCKIRGGQNYWTVSGKEIEGVAEVAEAAMSSGWDALGGPIYGNKEYVQAFVRSGRRQ